MISKNQILFCILTCNIAPLLARLEPSKKLTITADRNFLHQHDDAKCLILINPIGTVTTPNNMDQNGNIILDEKRNTTIIDMLAPKDGKIQIKVDFECNCFITDYTISYTQLANKGNIINVYADHSEIIDLSKKKNGTKPLIGKATHKENCQKNKRPERHVALDRHGRMANHETEIRPGPVVQTPTREMTIADIVNTYHDARHMLQAFINQGYSQTSYSEDPWSNGKMLREYDLAETGKLSEEQIKYIMQRLP